MPIVCLSRAGTDSFVSRGAAAFGMSGSNASARAAATGVAPEDADARAAVRSIPASGFGDGCEDGQRRRGAPK